MTVTRADLARRARVSPAVVSYVVNGGPRGVAPATRARVAFTELTELTELTERRIVREALSQGHTLGVFVSSDSQALGVYQACADLGYSHRLPGSPSRPTPPAGLALHPHLPGWLGPGRTRPQRQARRPRTSFRLRVRGLTAEHEGCGLAFESEPSYSAQSPRTRRRHSRRRTTEVSTGRSAGVGRQVPGRDAAAEPCAIADPRRPVAS